MIVSSSLMTGNNFVVAGFVLFRRRLCGGKYVDGVIEFWECKLELKLWSGELKFVGNLVRELKIGGDKGENCAFTLESTILCPI